MLRVDLRLVCNAINLVDLLVGLLFFFWHPMRSGIFCKRKGMSAMPLKIGCKIVIREKLIQKVIWFIVARELSPNSESIELCIVFECFFPLVLRCFFSLFWFVFRCESDRFKHKRIHHYVHTTYQMCQKFKFRNKLITFLSWLYGKVQPTWHKLRDEIWFLSSLQMPWGCCDPFFSVSTKWDLFLFPPNNIKLIRPFYFSFLSFFLVSV